ncbi:protein with a bacterial immunoglobulin-like domain [Legionella beliardensis]|uniref:Protein with a bacterial immunoglobulin-like domain n=1 Tax=Legionella beliardensis TaxID=91822 RepID=A0A378I5Q8_9GAMM|nr:thioredoxin fold domain-containing protein [Legionella beliardensis]STX30182.1 protein with a bacterial immunoglobulin-like domain [Legionella beliardensis]
MKNFIQKFIILIAALPLAMHSIFLHAGSKPTFRITPSTPTTLQAPLDFTFRVNYQVTNNTKITRTLTMVPIEGVKQNVEAGNCSKPFTLAAGQSCTLSLQINGSNLRPSGIHGGPVICKTAGAGNNAPDPFLCSRPLNKNLLHITPLNAAASGVFLYFGGIFHTLPQVNIKPYLFNLQRYAATFPLNSTLPLQTGLVSDRGDFIILGGTVVTDVNKINRLLSNSIRIPFSSTDSSVSNDIANLLAYQTANHQIIFIDKNLRYAVVGGQTIALIPDFQSTFSVYSMNLPSTSYGSLGQFPANFSYDLLGSLGSFVQGTATKTAYVFVEPNCPICHEFYQNIKPYIDSNQITIYWILTHFISDSSQGKAWAILDGRVPVGSGYPPTALGAWMYNEDNFNVNAPENIGGGGIPAITNPSPSAVQALNINEQFYLRYTGIIGVPTIVYKDNADKTQVLVGTPSDYNALINDIRG